MQFLRRLSLIDFALFLALIVTGALAIANQRGATGNASTSGTGFSLSNENIAAFETALEDLFNTLATGGAAAAPFAAVGTSVANAGDTAFATAVADLAAAHATQDGTATAAALRTINGLMETSPFATTFLTAYARGTLNFALDAGPPTPSTGREWVHLVWVDTANDAFVGWQVATGEAVWTVEPGNTAVSLAFTVPGQGYTGTLRLLPAGPGALIEASATFSIALAESIVALGEPVLAEEGILILDLGEAAEARPGQPWTGETRLGEPPGLLDDIRRAEAIAWTATIPDGRTFVMRIKLGETGRAAVASVFPA